MSGFGETFLLQARPSDSLDLHGLRAHEVERAVEPFLRRQPRGAVVHIITGRGRGSAGRPVLATKVRALLANRLQAYVECYVKDVDGGGYLVRRR